MPYLTVLLKWPACGWLLRLQRSANAAIGHADNSKHLSVLQPQQDNRINVSRTLGAKMACTLSARRENKSCMTSRVVLRHPAYGYLGWFLRRRVFLTKGRHTSKPNISWREYSVVRIAIAKPFSQHQIYLEFEFTASNSNFGIEVSVGVGVEVSEYSRRRRKRRRSAAGRADVSS